MDELNTRIEMWIRWALTQVPTQKRGTRAGHPDRLPAGTVRQEVVARGGTVVVDIVGSTVNLVSTEAADGFTAYIIHRGPSRVQVHFVGPAGITPSWLLCEGSPDVSCSFD